MLRFGLSAALLVAAAPVLAQSQATPSTQPQTAPPSAPPTAIQQAATAFGQCIAAGMQSVAATMSPEAGAASVLGGCSTQRQQLEQVAESYIATMPAERQAAAREHLRSGMAEAETQIVAAIRQQRGAAAPAPNQ